MSTSEQWIKLTDNKPTEWVVVKTKIDDEFGVRNEQELKYGNYLWWIPDGSMYVYYTPTHWKPL